MMQRVVFKGGGTVVLPCREADHLVWVRPRGILDDDVSIPDFWELRAGDSVTITSSYKDVPEWIALTPAETIGAAVHMLMADAGPTAMHRHRSEAACIWRVRRGDLLFWIGRPRGPLGDDSGILTLFECAEDVLVAGEPSEDVLDAWQFFGAPTSDTPNQYALRATQAAVQYARNRGTTIVPATEWAIEHP